MTRYRLGLVIITLMLSSIPIFGQRYNKQTTPPSSGGYIINGYYHSPNCVCSTCIWVKANDKTAEPKAIKKEATPTPPAPEDPNKNPAVKTDSDTTKGATKQDVLKTIEKSQTSEAIKKESINNLQKTPNSFNPSQLPEKTIATPKFNLIEALNYQNQIPAVKTFTDDTSPFKSNPKADQKIEPKTKKEDAKQNFITAPSLDEPGYELPATDVGVSIGGTIDFNNPWDVTKQVPYGKLIQFWVKPVSKRPDKLKSVAYTWTVLPREEVLQWPDTTRIILSSGSKNQNFVVMLTASYVYLDGDKIVQKANQAITMIQVSGATIPTGGGGNGGVNTGTTIGAPPASIGAIAKQAYEWSALILRNDTYNDDSIKQDARKLAAAFIIVADRIKRAELTDINDILRSSQTENGKALKDTESLWQPWFTKLSELLKDGYNKNTIQTPAQYEDTWREIAKGLEALSK